MFVSYLGINKEGGENYLAAHSVVPHTPGKGTSVRVKLGLVTR